MTSCIYSNSGNLNQLQKRAVLIAGRLFAFITNDRNSGTTVVIAYFLRCVLVISEGMLFGW